MSLFLFFIKNSLTYMINYSYIIGNKFEKSHQGDGLNNGVKFLSGILLQSRLTTLIGK